MDPPDKKKLVATCAADTGQEANERNFGRCTNRAISVQQKERTIFLYIDDSASERATVVVVVARSRILALIRTRYDRYLKRNPWCVSSSLGFFMVCIPILSIRLTRNKKEEDGRSQTVLLNLAELRRQITFRWIPESTHQHLTHLEIFSKSAKT